MMKPTILFCGYRDWSLKIYFFIKNKYEHKINFVIIKTQKEFNKKIKYINPALIFFVGWSWIVEKNIVNKYKCVCLHPSSLPKYRGGSPLQHQIINNEKESAVTFFVMNEFLDKGPIVWQGKFSLEGNLNEIYFRITQKGKKGISTIINEYINKGIIKGKPQNEREASYYKRRTPEQSEIKVSDFRKCTARQLYNKIRALQDPYPNAFVICKNGTKLFIQKAKVEEAK